MGKKFEGTIGKLGIEEKEAWKTCESLKKDRLNTYLDKFSKSKPESPEKGNE